MPCFLPQKAAFVGPTFLLIGLSPSPPCGGTFSQHSAGDSESGDSNVAELLWCSHTTPVLLWPHTGLWLADTYVMCTINAIFMGCMFLNTNTCYIYVYSLPCILFIHTKQTFHILWLFIYLFILYHLQKETVLELIFLPPPAYL